MRKDFLRNIGLLTTAGALLTTTSCSSTAAQESPQTPSGYPKTERTSTSYRRIFSPTDFTRGPESYIDIRLAPHDNTHELVIMNGSGMDNVYRAYAVAQTYCGGIKDYTALSSYGGVLAGFIGRTGKPDCPNLIPYDLNP